MILYSDDGRTKDVQPKYVAREEAKGWSRKPPKSSRRPRWEPKPDKASGDVSETEGES